MIHGEFLSGFSEEIREAHSRDLPSGFMRYIMQPQGKTLAISKAGI